MTTTPKKLEITAVDARDFKRLAEVRVETGGHRNLLLVAGKNTAGKSSLMDALTVALGGKDALPADPVRHGADKATVTVELDGGRYTITRTVTGRGKDLKTSLRVVGPDGAISAPQTWLDGIVAGRFLDPVAFLAIPADRQRQTLLALVGVDVASIDAERKRVYEERTAVNRDAKAAAARRAAIGEPPPAPPLGRAPAEIQAEGDKIAAQIAEASAAGALIAQAERNLLARAAEHARLLADETRLLAELERVRAEVDRSRTAVEAADAEKTKASAPIDTSGLEARRASLRAEFQAANARASWEAAAKAHQAQVERADAEVAKLQADADAKTVALAQIDARKAALLAAAQMPVTDLGVADDGLTLGGVPFGQASQAERLRCSLAIAMRQSPRLRDIWVRDGALLDDDGIALVREMAEANDCRVWLEVVGEDEPGAIVFRDGRIVEPRCFPHDAINCAKCAATDRKPTRDELRAAMLADETPGGPVAKVLRLVPEAEEAPATADDDADLF